MEVLIGIDPHKATNAVAAVDGEGALIELATFDREDPELRLVLGRWILELGEPGWQHIERAAVELLIGRPLDEPERR